MTARALRALQLADVATLQSIDLAAHGEAWSYRVFAEDHERPDRFHLVADCDGEIVGHAAAWIDDGSCRITNVAVASDHVGKGHATALLLGLITAVLEAPGVLNMQLEVRPENRRAQRLYSRFGFVPVGVDRGFYTRADAQGCRDALVMAVADVCSGPWRERLDQIRNDAVDLDKGAAA